MVKRIHWLDAVPNKAYWLFTCNNLQKELLEKIESIHQHISKISGLLSSKEDPELRMVIDASMRPVGRFIPGDNKRLSPERKKAIKKEFLSFTYRLTLIRSELELQEGISYLKISGIL